MNHKCYKNIWLHQKAADKARFPLLNECLWLKVMLFIEDEGYQRNTKDIKTDKNIFVRLFLIFSSKSIASQQKTENKAKLPRDSSHFTAKPKIGFLFAGFKWYSCTNRLKLLRVVVAARGGMKLNWVGDIDLIMYRVWFLSVLTSGEIAENENHGNRQAGNCSMNSLLFDDNLNHRLSFFFEFIFDKEEILHKKCKL